MQMEQRNQKFADKNFYLCQFSNKKHLPVPTTGPKLKNLNQDHSLKKVGFSGQIRVKFELW